MQEIGWVLSVLSIIGAILNAKMIKWGLHLLDSGKHWMGLFQLAH